MTPEELRDALSDAAHERDVARAALDRALGELLDLKRERRDRFASAALTGLLANFGDSISHSTTAAHATRYADALIAALDKPQEPKP
jgi:hypothetical protein